MSWNNDKQAFISGEIDMCVMVQRCEYGTITKDMIKRSIRLNDDDYDVDRDCNCDTYCCLSDSDKADRKCDLLDVIWEKIVEALCNADCTINESDCGSELFGRRGGLDMDEVVRMLIEENWDEAKKEHSCG